MRHRRPSLDALRQAAWGRGDEDDKRSKDVWWEAGAAVLLAAWGSHARPRRNPEQGKVLLSLRGSVSAIAQRFPHTQMININQRCVCTGKLLKV